MKDSIVVVISRAVEELLSGALWKNRLNSLIAAVVGLILSGEATMAAIGGSACGRARVVNKIKRVWRLAHNQHLDLNRVAARLIQVLTFGQRSVVVAIDWTDMGRWKVLQAAIITAGRAIPVYWMVINEKKMRLAEAELRFCETMVLRLIPADKRLFIIGDRGFDSAETLRFLKERRIKFLIRFARGKCLKLKGQDYVLVENMPLSLGEAVDYSWAEYTRHSQLPLRIVRVWKDGQDEEWNLASNLGRYFTAEFIVKLYARRFTIEELFRDYKGGAWGIGETSIQSEKSLATFLLILAVAHIVVVAIGLDASERGLAREFRSTDGLSLFRLGIRVLQAALDSAELLPSCEFSALFRRLPIEFEEIWALSWRQRKTIGKGPYQSSKQKTDESIDGRALRVFIEGCGITQADAGRLLGIRGGCVGAVVRERHPMPAAWLPKLAELSGLAPEEFLTIDDACKIRPHVRQRVLSLLEQIARPSPREPRPTRAGSYMPPRPTLPTKSPRELRERIQRAFVEFMRQGQFRNKDIALLVGVTRSRIRQAVVGTDLCQEHWLPILCKAFDITVEEFMGLAEGGVLPPKHTDRVKQSAIIQQAFREFVRVHCLDPNDIAAVVGVPRQRVVFAISGRCVCEPEWVRPLCEAYGIEEHEFISSSAARSILQPTAVPVRTRQEKLHRAFLGFLKKRRPRPPEVAVVLGTSRRCFYHIRDGETLFKPEWIARLCQFYAIAEDEFLAMGDFLDSCDVKAGVSTHAA